MTSLRGGIFRPILLVVFLLAALSWLHAENPTLTTDWVAGPGNSVGDLPSFAWLQDGTAIFDDGTFERLDPLPQNDTRF